MWREIIDEFLKTFEESTQRTIKISAVREVLDELVKERVIEKYFECDIVFEHNNAFAREELHRDLYTKVRLALEACKRDEGRIRKLDILVTTSGCQLATPNEVYSKYFKRFAGNTLKYEGYHYITQNRYEEYFLIDKTTKHGIPVYVYLVAEFEKD